MEQEPNLDAFTCPHFSIETDTTWEGIMFIPPAPKSVKSQGFSFVTLECRTYYLWVSEGTSNPRTQQYAHVHIQSSAWATVSDTLLGHVYWMNVAI